VSVLVGATQDLRRDSMSATGLSTFDETVHLSNRWLNELMSAVNWDDKYRAYRLLRSTLHALRDRLPAHEAVELGAQLPILIRGLYYDGWHLTDAPLRERTKEAFLAHVEAAFKQDPNENTEDLVREVFKLLAAKISKGEIEDVMHALPGQVRALWPAAGEPE
jgi:uncharacterized protein (DUF2267 family)